MPHIDRRTGEVVMRIVYDGAPEAGKTTNIQKLCETVALQRRGELKSPGTAGRRTEFFDWLDFAGGYVDGRKVRCQIVSVPGQTALLHRRRYLLDTADAVVFVADSRPDAIASNVESLAITLRVVETRADVAPVGIVLQANKQDLPGALAPRELASAYGLPAGGSVLGAKAHVGEGIMQTFIVAVRLATDRIRALALSGQLAEIVAEQESPEAVYAAMLQREPGSMTGGVRAGASRRSILASDEPEDAPAQFSLSAPCANPAAQQPMTLPPASVLGAGHIWPPATGRQLLIGAGLDDCTAPEHLSPWAPADGIELLSSAWTALHSRERWKYATEHEARVALIGQVRTHLRVPMLLPEGRVLFMAPSDDGFRLWMATPKVPTLGELTGQALQSRNVTQLAQALGAACQLGSAVAELSEISDRSLIRATLEAFGRMHNGSWALLALPEANEETVVAPFLERLFSSLLETASRNLKVGGLLRDAYRMLPRAHAAQLSFLEAAWTE